MADGAPQVTPNEETEPTMLAAALARTTRAQHAASDPAASAWVSANAGTGKTYVLTTRVLRLLLSGTQPERILALTYTKAAAAEMSKRVFDRLGTWVTAAPAVLTERLAEVLQRPPQPDELARARRLFASVIETPGGLKVQTIHGFCERLLKRFPLEAGIPPHFEILDETRATALQRAAIDATLTDAMQVPDGRLARALRVAITYAADDSFDNVLRDALRRRDWLAEMMTLYDQTDPDVVAAVYRRALGVPDGLDIAACDHAIATVLDEVTLARAITVLSAGKPTDAKLADLLRTAVQAKEARSRGAALQRALLTKEGEPRSDGRFITQAIRLAEPALTDALCRARDALVAHADRRQKLLSLDATCALLTLADAVLSAYQAGKARRAALDFDDLIAKSANLLATIGATGAASTTQWVLFKLDGGLDHILVDEAQDTGPLQWKVIAALADEFFADGAGHREQRGARTLFAVGDEKQSIYGFQGAAPEMFKQMGDTFERDAVAVGQPLARVPLNVSFRTTTPVLQAVDRVFGDALRVSGVASGVEAIRHIAHRAGRAGIVEVWPTEKPEDPAPSDVWEPNSEQTSASPVTRLAGRIADCIDGWLTSGERLLSENRPMQASDILVLVRRRRPFAPAMVAALKARGIPVAGADRLTLTDQIAVQDLMVLGDFLSLPEDDLALATVLKSPLFGIGDDALMPLARERKGQLWTELLARAKTDLLFHAAAETLKRWRSQADYLPPYEFYARLLDDDNGAMRKRMLGRLGYEAADPIDEFLNQALKYDDTSPASLTGFLAALRASDTEIKRDMEQGRNEVRVMTVHGAKGLEAPVVFLPDTCSAKSGARAGGLLKLVGVPMPVGVRDLMLWPVKTAKTIAAIDGARAALKSAEQEERNRLLYVALTRPRDRLYITGYEGAHAPLPDSWYAQVSDALRPIAEATICADGRTGLRLASPQTAAPEKSTRTAAADAASKDLPDWARTRPKSERRLTVPLAPSRLAPLETDETGEPASVPRQGPQVPPPLPPSATSDQRRFLRGTLTHAILEHLPNLPQTDWAAAAARFLAVRGKDLTEAARQSIAREALAVLHDPVFAPLFGPDSQAEVPVVAEIPRPHGRAGPPLRLNGQIDRLARVGNEILMVDYKTNRPPPQAAGGVAEAYLLQLAAYRLALARIFPGHRVKAAIVWTDGARLMPIPSAMLDAAEHRLWSLDTLH